MRYNGNGRTTRDADHDVGSLWEEYTNRPTEHLRNLLIERYLPLVKYNAERVHAKLPDEVDIEDLMSAGIFGLMDAIDGYDPGRGVKFETYVAPRIRGAILDELRNMDWVPRLVRSRSSWVDGARARLERKHGRRPTDDEIMREIGVDASEYQKIRRDASVVGVVSLSRKWFETDSNKDVREIDVLADAQQQNPLTEVQRRDLRELITRGLSRAERLIVILYYYEQMTMKEIGATLAVSESRVSQVHASIIARLQAQLYGRNPSDLC